MQTTKERKPLEDLDIDGDTSLVESKILRLPVG
jgi:hypothetical protein